MKKEEYKIIEVFNNKGKKVEDVLTDIFKSYVEKQLNLYKDLNIKK